MKRYRFILALAAVSVIGLTGCHWDATLGMGTVTASSTVTIDEWAQTNFLKAVDDLIAKVPDPNKDANDGDGEDDEGELLEHDVPGVEDLGSGDGVDGG